MHLLACFSRPGHQALRTLLLAPLLVALAVLATGCGDPSPEERFFEDACSKALPRAQELLETYEEVVQARAAPGPDARLELLGFTKRGVEVARRFRSQIQALPELDTSAGSKARLLLETSASAALETLAEEERRVRSLPANITLMQSSRGLQRLVGVLIITVSDMTGIGAVAAEAGLSEPFEGADSCTELEALTGD